MKKYKQFLIEKPEPPQGLPRPADVMPRPEGGEGGGRSITDPIERYLEHQGGRGKELLDSIIKYFSDRVQDAQAARETAAEQGELLNRLREPGGAKDVITGALEQPFGAMKSNVGKLRSGTGFLGQFVRNTQAELASKKIPKSPKADLGEPAGLRKRVNTKGFYK